jgi:hypothetical protein
MYKIYYILYFILLQIILQQAELPGVAWDKRQSDTPDTANPYLL